MDESACFSDPKQGLSLQSVNVHAQMHAMLLVVQSNKTFDLLLCDNVALYAQQSNAACDAAAMLCVRLRSHTVSACVIRDRSLADPSCRLRRASRTFSIKPVSAEASHNDMGQLEQVMHNYALNLLKFCIALKAVRLQVLFVESGFGCDQHGQNATVRVLNDDAGRLSHVTIQFLQAQSG